MAKPWIGIPTRYHDKTETIGQIRHYLDAVFWAGGIPLMIPLIAEGAALEEYLRKIDGILLPGSPTDVDPVHYRATAHPRLGRLYPERDATDFALIDHADRTGLPLLGICFGAQSLNVWRGGDLVQDIPSLVPGAVVHDNDADDAGSSRPARHIVRIPEDSLIAKLAAKTELDVNSYHHQSIGTPGRNLRVSAVAEDGVIEAVEDTTGRFVVGVQWHPERGWKEDGFSRALFYAFIREAQRSTTRDLPV